MDVWAIWSLLRRWIHKPIWPTASEMCRPHSKLATWQPSVHHMFAHHHSQANAINIIIINVCGLIIVVGCNGCGELTNMVNAQLTGTPVTCPTTAPPLPTTTTTLSPSTMPPKCSACDCPAGTSAVIIANTETGFRATYVQNPVNTCQNYTNGLAKVYYCALVRASTLSKRKTKKTFVVRIVLHPRMIRLFQ